MAKSAWGLLWLLLVLASPLAAQEGDRRSVTVEYFGLPTCHDCQEFLTTTWEDLRRTAANSGIDFVLIERDILDPEAFARMKTLLLERTVTFTGVPVLVAGDRVLQGDDLEPVRLAALLGVSGTALPPSQDTAVEPALSWAVVGLAGLVDGVNPCVLTLLLFLLSVWKVDRRGGLSLGVAYALGVFTAYTLVGLGLLQAAVLVESAPWASAALRTLAVVGLGVLVVLSVVDAFRARAGRGSTMTLKLPGVVDRTIRGLVRSRRGLAVGLPVAFGLGALISLLEFVCTGQVYLPTLVYLNRTGGSDALALLLWYNLAFIVPLVAVFLLVHLGTGHSVLVGWAKKHLAASKLLLALVYGLLALVLVLSP